MKQTTIKVGPADNGRRMSLADFEFAEVVPGYHYELERGVIIVSDIPNLPHFAQVAAIRRQLGAYDIAHPGAIYAIASGSECKLLVPEFDSERHPDLAIFKTSPPGSDSTTWRKYLPEIVIEVVSASSEARDYRTKRDEYLAVGIREYWIFDAEQEEMLVLRRRGKRWVEERIRPPKTYASRQLPGLDFDCGAVFAAARAVPD